MPAVGAYRVEDPTQYGVLHTDGNGERVRDVVEKPADPPSDLINAGADAFPAGVLEILDIEESERGEREITDILQAVCDANDVAAVPFDRWLDVGRPWELLAANEWKVDDCQPRIDGDVHEDADSFCTDVIEVPSLGRLEPLVANVALEFFTYHVANLQDRPIDNPPEPREVRPRQVGQGSLAPSERRRPRDPPIARGRIRSVNVSRPKMLEIRDTDTNAYPRLPASDE